MQALRLAFMPPALGSGYLLLDTPVEMPRKEFLPITRGRRILYSEIDTDRLEGSGTSRDRFFRRKAEPSVTDRILGKAAAFPLVFFQMFPFEYPTGLPRESQRIASTL